MTPEIIKIEPMPGSEDVVRIFLSEVDDIKPMLKVLQNTFDKFFNNGVSKIILDFKNIHFPTSSLIALLIEGTSRARRLNGDIKLINVSHTAKNNLATFTPLSYLTVEANEKYALEGFQTSSMNSGDRVIPSQDIAEVPIIEKFQESFKEIKNEKGYHLRVKSMPSYLYNICDFVTGYAEKAGMHEREIGKTKIAVYEACLNVIEHAYHSNPDNWIDVWVEYDNQKFIIIIQDYGMSFEFKNQKGYDVEAAVEGRQTGGFGLYIIRRSMDEVDYQSDHIHGNRLKMVKYLY